MGDVQSTSVIPLKVQNWQLELEKLIFSLDRVDIHSLNELTVYTTVSEILTLQCKPLATVNCKSQYIKYYHEISNRYVCMHAFI